MDKWIIGVGANSDLEYIVHTQTPRFIARLEIESDEAKSLSFALVTPGGHELFDFQWFDPVPDEKTLQRLAASADEAVYLDSLKTPLVDGDE